MTVHVLSAKMPVELVEQLRACARANERTMSAELRLALREHLGVAAGDTKAIS